MDTHNLDQTGQHYMIDKKLIRFIAKNSELTNKDIVLEIGYGKGALTKELAKHCAVIGIDIEDCGMNLDPQNKFRYLKLIRGNILDKIENIKQEYKFNKIISNIPYNISEPLFRKLFKIDFELCVLTMGKDFANLLTDEKQKSKNRIGIIANELYEIKLLKTVKPDSFFPRPRVDSAVISIKPKKIDKTNSIYKKIVFLDDKKLKNVMEKIIENKTKKQIKEITDKNKLFEKKLYELNNEEFVEFNELLSHLQ